MEPFWAEAKSWGPRCRGSFIVFQVGIHRDGLERYSATPSVSLFALPASCARRRLRNNITALRIIFFIHCRFKYVAKIQNYCEPRFAVGIFIHFLLFKNDISDSEGEEF